MDAGRADHPEVESDRRPALRRATADFTPARIRTSPPRPTTRPRWTVRFLTRPIGGSRIGVLDGDPTVDPPPAVGRLVVNAGASLAAALVLGLAVVGIVPSFFGYRSVVVTSAAMSPSIGPGDVVILRPAGDGQLPVGAVVEADRDGEGVHLQRVVDVVGGRYRVASDADPGADQGTVAGADVRGVGIMIVPLVGRPMLWIDEGRWFPLIVLGGGLAAVVYAARAAWVDQPLRGRRVV